MLKSIIYDHNTERRKIHLKVREVMAVLRTLVLIEGLSCDGAERICAQKCISRAQYRIMRRNSGRCTATSEKGPRIYVFPC